MTRAPNSDPPIELCAARIVVRGRPSVPNHFIALFSTLISGAGSSSNLYFREGLIRYCESTVFCFISSIKTSSPWILTATTPTPIAQSLSCTPRIIVHMFSTRVGLKKWGCRVCPRIDRCTECMGVAHGWALHFGWGLG
ncbi:hypothetical protein DFH08DRAFT_1087706 [Mycena albidolilacea]|uniref:Uncharacterized protein n=1 Tax=Mycena albidolilacea TaxID=1033008 RepID=A0AAD7EDD9_9AGAR|nr:hypothetical protein DFH08DRAFT_1087706 [Mycena albidolilacea]